MSGPRVALVAGGGAVKAYAFHVGVLAGLKEDGFHFRSGLRFQPNRARPGQREIQTYVGSSAGGCVLASVASGHGVEELKNALLGTAKHVPTFGYRTLFVPVAPHPLNYLKRLAKRFKLGGMGLEHLLNVGGIFTTSGVERYFRENVLPTNRFADLAADLFLTATQVNGVRKVVFGRLDSLDESGDYDRSCAYFNNVQISQALAAAIAVPPIFAPYSIVNPSSGTKIQYYDGEVREALSPHIARDNGADFIIASSIWSPYQYDEKVGTLASYGMSVLAEQAIHQAIEQKVDQDRRQSELYDKLLSLIEERDARLGLRIEERDSFLAEVSELLGHRRSNLLYIVPDRGDRDFFFSGAFTFGSRMVERCHESGRRAYRLAVKRNPEFLHALDHALRAESSSTPAL